MTQSADHASSNASRLGRAVAVIVLVTLSFLPIGNWLGIPFQPALWFRGAEWISGSLILVLVTTLLSVATLRHRGEFARRATARAVGYWGEQPVRSTAALACLAAAAYITISWVVLSARPLLIDELVQTIQARTFLEGRLWLPLDAHPEFRSIMHMVEQDGRWYSQFPPGGPAMLALGELFHAPWIVNPVCGAVSVAAFAMSMRWSRVRDGVSLGASLLFAFAPFVVFQSASHMNHVTSLTWLLIASAALVRATTSETDRGVAGFICGLGLGIAATIRPLDAAAWAIPAGVWLAGRAFTRGHWRAFLLSGFGVAVPMACMLYINAQMTGKALEFGYTVLWGKAHGLGFHESPWGENHTIARGIALTAAYLNSLNESMFEWPVPSLLPAFATMCFAYLRTGLERYLLVTGAFVMLAYFAYWHDGFFLGPRFMYSLTPLIALLVAQLPGLVEAKWPSRGFGRIVLTAYAAAFVVSACWALPRRAIVYAGGFQSMRADYDDIAKRAGATGSLILVRESWGAQVIQRLWALGVSRSFTEILYRRVDTCGLDDMATQLEQSGVRGAAAEDRLRPMLADSARVVLSSLSPDGTERVLPGSSYPPSCMRRIEEDRGGYTLYGPMLLARDTTTRWIRDLHARDSLAVSASELEHAWIMRRNPAGLTPILERANADSIRRSWRNANN